MTATTNERSRDASLYNVAAALADAYTLAEIEAALQAFAEHKRQFKQDSRMCADDICHGFPRFMEAAQIRREQAEAAGLTAEEEAERDRLLKETLDTPQGDDAMTLLQEQEARLNDYLRRFPDDPFVLGRVNMVIEQRRFLALLAEWETGSPAQESAQEELLLQKR